MLYFESLADTNDYTSRFYEQLQRASRNHEIVAGCSVNPLLPTNEAHEQRLVEITNDLRATFNLPPLKRTSELDSAARYHLHDMTADRYYDHATHDLAHPDNHPPSHVKGCTATQRISQALQATASSEEDYGENLLITPTELKLTPDQVVEEWLSIAAYRAHILNPRFREIGVGVAMGELTIPSGTAYRPFVWWGRALARADVYPLVINREYAETNNPQVEIYIYGQWQQMRLRNDNGNLGFMAAL